MNLPYLKFFSGEFGVSLNSKITFILLIILGTAGTFSEFYGVFHLMHAEALFNPNSLMLLSLGVFLRGIYSLLSFYICFSYEFNLNKMLISRISESQLYERELAEMRQISSKILFGSQLIALSLIAPLLNLIQLAIFLLFLALFSLFYKELQLSVDALILLGLCVFYVAYIFDAFLVLKGNFCLHSNASFKFK